MSLHAQHITNRREPRIPVGNISGNKQQSSETDEDDEDNLEVSDRHGGFS